MEKVIIEMVVAANLSGEALFDRIRDRLPQVDLDNSFEPVDLAPRKEDLTKIKESEKVVVVRGMVSSSGRLVLDGTKGILNIWSDGVVAPFGEGAMKFVIEK